MATQMHGSNIDIEVTLSESVICARVSPVLLSHLAKAWSPKYAARAARQHGAR